MDLARLQRCRDMLVEVAKARGRITYGELAKHVGTANQALRPFLDAIYQEETAAGRPDLTLVAVNKDTGYGRYNSGGGEARSVGVDPRNTADVEAYDAALARVYEFWVGRSST